MVEQAVGYFDDDLLKLWMQTHYGYGNYAGDYWFVGMEEGCRGCTSGQIMQRMALWDGRGRHELDDVRDYHLTLGVTWPFDDAPRLQPTWRGLMRIVLGAQRVDVTREELREYQRTRLARHGGDTCLLEFLPLPSPSASDWFYAEHSRIPFLVSRRRYRDACAPWRADHIKQRIAQHQPKAVVFYSTNKWYRHWWEFIAGVPFESLGKDDPYVGRSPTTTYVIMKHPTAHGVSTEYLQQVADVVRG